MNRPFKEKIMEENHPLQCPPELKAISHINEALEILKGFAARQDQVSMCAKALGVIGIHFDCQLKKGEGSEIPEFIYFKVRVSKGKSFSDVQWGPYYKATHEEKVDRSWLEEK